VKRRILRPGALLLAAIALLSGCETLGHTKHSGAHDEAKSDSEDTKEGAGFFKSSRVPGAMSSEGREIERSLGIQ
jgi:hypothetical protein